MGLFGPKEEACFICSEQMPKQDLQRHWISHLIEVQADTGGRGYTFECPSCGPMSECWGAGEEEQRAKVRAVCAIDVHLMQRHSGVGSSVS